MKVLLDISFLKKKVRVTIPKRTTILEIKEYVEDHYEIPLHYQNVVHRGDVLADDFQIGRIRRTVVKLLIIGHVPKDLLKIHVNDIIEYVIGFLDMEDVRVCCRVCHRWRDLALLGSEFNETRFCFLDDRRTCFDLILERTVYKLPAPFINVADLVPSTLLQDEARRSSRRTLFIGGEHKDELCCVLTSSNKMMWQQPLVRLKPERVVEKQRRFRRKLRVFQHDDMDVDDDRPARAPRGDAPGPFGSSGQKAVPGPDAAVQDRLRRFRDLVGPQAAAPPPAAAVPAPVLEIDQDQHDFDDCREHPDYDNYDAIIGCHFDLKRKMIYVQFDSWISAVDAAKASLSTFFDPDMPSLQLWGDLWDHYTVFDTPMSFDDVALFVPYRNQVFVLAKSGLGLLKVVRLPHASQLFGRIFPLDARTLLDEDHLEELEEVEEGEIEDFDSDSVHCYAIVKDSDRTVSVLSRDGEVLRPPIQNVRYLSPRHAFDIHGTSFRLNVPMLKSSYADNPVPAVRTSPHVLPLRMCENSLGLVAGYYCIDKPFRKYKEDKEFDPDGLLLRLLSLFPEYDRKWDRDEHRFKTTRKTTTGPIWTVPFAVRDPQQEDAISQAEEAVRRHERPPSATGDPTDRALPYGMAAAAPARAAIRPAPRVPLRRPPANVMTRVNRDRLYLVFWIQDLLHVLCVQGQSGDTIYHCPIRAVERIRGDVPTRETMCVRAGVTFLQLHFARHVRSFVINTQGNIILEVKLDLSE